MSRRTKINPKNRTAALASVASKMDMEFEAKDSSALYYMLKDFTLFRKGRRKKVLNVMSFTDDMMEVQFHVFDYHYTRGSGNSKKTRRQTVFFVNSKLLGLPEMQLKPETILHKLGHFLGIEDINFEEFPKFSGQYYLTGEDEELVRHAMNEKALRFFTNEKGWCMEGLNYYMVLYKRNKLASTKSVKTLIRKGKQLHEIFKIK